MKRSQGSSDSHGPGLTVLPGSQEMFTDVETLRSDPGLGTILTQSPS